MIALRVVHFMSEIKALSTLSAIRYAWLKIHILTFYASFSFFGLRFAVVFFVFYMYPINKYFNTPARFKGNLTVNNKHHQSHCQWENKVKLLKMHIS